MKAFAIIRALAPVYAFYVIPCDNNNSSLVVAAHVLQMQCPAPIGHVIISKKKVFFAQNIFIHFSLGQL